MINKDIDYIKINNLFEESLNKMEYLSNNVFELLDILESNIVDELELLSSSLRHDTK